MAAAEEGGRYIEVEVVAPDGPVWSGEAAMVVVPAVGGELGILPRHAPLVAQLAIGECRIKTRDNNWVSLAIAEGFVKVQFDKVIVLADAAELATEIDLERAERAVEQATERLKMAREGTVPEDESIDVYKEEMHLRRARNRIKVVRKV
ncbi:MAG: F0F1 ATP synthase subunit epsilon [Thermoleophilia bacterium]